MEDRAEKPLADTLKGSTVLQRLVRSRRIFDALDRELQPRLPPAARGHVRVACVQQDTLVLAAASSAWASRARLESSSLLEAARALWPGRLERVQIIVSPGLD